MTWPNTPPTYRIMTLTYMIPVLVAVAFLMLIKRKILNYSQSQK